MNVGEVIMKIKYMGKCVLDAGKHGSWKSGDERELEEKAGEYLTTLKLHNGKDMFICIDAPKKAKKSKKIIVENMVIEECRGE